MMWVNVEIISEKGIVSKKYYHILSKYFPYTALGDAQNKTCDELERREKGTK